MKVEKLNLKLALMVGVLGLAAQANANLITSLYNTGVDSSGAPLANGATDSHYTLTVPSGSTTPIAVTSAGGFPVVPNGPWIGDDNSSAWIRPNNPNVTDPVGVYTFTTTFSLSGLDASTAQIAGKWATDNYGEGILLNGNVVSFTGAPGLGAFTSTFDITSGFISGLNTLAFVVNNAYDNSGNTSNPTGLRVEMTGTASPVPEASTVVSGSLLLLPIGAMALGMLRKRKSA